MAKKQLRLAETLALGTEIPVTRESVDWLFDFALRPGEIVSVGDNRGKWFRARVTKCSTEELRVLVFEEMDQSPESDLFLVLLQAVPNKERMELVIEKSVELGVDVIQPFFSERSYQLEELPQAKWRRWQDRARKAADQCRRGKVPRVLEPRKLDAALEVASAAEVGVVLYENERENRLKDFLAAKAGAKSCALIVGPEGGFAPEEIRALRGLGICPVSLGGRILRTETAAIVGLGLIQFCLGDLGGRS